MSKINYHPGLSLVELLFVMAIIGVALVSALPAYQSLLQKNTTTVRINRLVAALHFARNSAMVLGGGVALCPYQPSLGCGDNWSRGMYIFLNSHGDGQLVSKGQLLRVVPSFLPGELRWNRQQFLIQFSALGMLQGQVGHFDYQPPTGKASGIKTVILSKTGRVRKG